MSQKRAGSVRSDVVADMQYAAWAETWVPKARCVMETLDILYIVNFIRFYVRDDLGITDVPVSHAVMLPLEIVRVVGG